MEIKRVGIIGAGKLGVTLAQLALAAGYEVRISGSGSPEKIKLATRIVTPGATEMTTDEVVKNSDIVILALPLGRFRSLDPDLFTGKLVLDAMNHWFEIDGPLKDIIPHGERTSTTVARHLRGVHLVKAFNHMSYHHLRDEAKPHGAKGRRAIAFASDTSAHNEAVADFIDSLGFDPLSIGNLDSSQPLEAGQSAFGANLTLPELADLIKK